MKKLTPLSIRFDPDVKAALDEAASAEDRSLAWIVNRALREHFGLPKPKATKAAKPKG
jgi:predicted transcriptional regulator